MTLYRLKVFVCVAKHLNITRAARELYTTQPSVSRHLKTLEREYGVTLYRITRNGIHVTDSGREFLTHAEALIAHFQAFKNKFRGRTENADFPVLRVGGSFGATATLLPSALARYHRIYPQTRVISSTASSSQLQQQLLDSKQDLVLLTRPSGLPSLVYEQCGQERVVAIASSNHPIARKPRLSPKDLGQIPLVVRSRIKGQMSTAESRLREFEKNGVELNFAMFCDSHFTLVASVERGVGIGFVRRDWVEKEVKQRRLKILRTPWLKLYRNYYAAYSKEPPIAPAVQDFLALLRERTEKHPRPVNHRRISLHDSHVGLA